MEIRDIIKTDSDRLFIVDPECYIIFTGETTDDIKPFIRIGNWNDMPVELIPLIENIIITDNLIGNPAHEQFNIDVRHLPENRYIGSRGIVKKFLDYQKIFGLDLTNASIVDIEKDLPELSKEKNISHKDQFIGVFYRDGNFKVLLNKNTIFDLNRIAGGPISWQKFHDLLSESHKNSGRYDGSGMVIIGHNPLFYHKKHFYAYLFPANYVRDCSLLGIDPGKIQAVLHPSLNLINLSKFFKWLNNTGRRIRIYSNSADVNMVRKLFSHASIANSDFSGLSYRADTGLVIRNYPGTYNLRLDFGGIRPQRDRLSVAFIKGAAGARNIIREKLDALLISYSAYEDILMLLKSTGAPVAVIDDGNRNIGKLAGGGRIVLSPGLHYEFRSYRLLDDLARLAGLGDGAPAGAVPDAEALTAMLSSAAGEELHDAGRRTRLFNLVSLARARLSTTRDRATASRLRSAADALSVRVGRPAMFVDPSRSVILLALHNGVLYQFIADYDGRGGARLFDEIHQGGDDATGKPDIDLLPHYDRIISDRERLRHLIEIYTRSERYHAKNLPGLHKLKRAISTRKDQYREESLSLERSWSRSIAPVPVETEPPDTTGPKSGAAGSLAEKIRSMPAAVKIAIPLFILLIVAAMLLWRNAPIVERFFLSDRIIPVQSRDIDVQYRQLGKQMNIKIKDHDILMYANRVAVKNGYHKIAETKLKERNPDWIYPDNVFIMLDGQRVVVSKGDTLWNLSKNKLIESTIRFNEIMKRIEAADSKTRPGLIQEARRNAYTSEQQDMIRKLGGTPPDVKRDTGR